MEQYDDKFWPPVKESILKTHSDGTFSFTAEPDVFHFGVRRWALGCRAGLDSGVWTSNFEPREQIYTPEQHTLIHQLGPTLSGRLKLSQPCFEGGRGNSFRLRALTAFLAEFQCEMCAIYVSIFWFIYPSVSGWTHK